MKQFSRLLSCDLHWETKHTGYRGLNAIVSVMFTIEMTVLEVFGQNHFKGNEKLPKLHSAHAPTKSPFT